MCSMQYSRIAKIQESKARRLSFAKMMKGVHSAHIKLKPFAYGEPSEGAIYRKFFYNNHGKVIKKLKFSSSGKLEMKEGYQFDKAGRILRSQFITDNSIQEEKYVYHSKGYLEEYLFNNSGWEIPKREKYDVDKSLRKIKKVSYGRLGIPELITHYLYKGKNKKYSYRHVTHPDGSLIITLKYSFDKKNNLKNIHGFQMTPEEVICLTEEDKSWEMKSLFRSTWTYDTDNNPIAFQRDEKAESLSLLGENAFVGSLESGRIITLRSNSEFEKINGHFYLAKTTEWLAKYNEPLKEIKEYTYYDATEKEIFSSTS